MSDVRDHIGSQALCCPECGTEIIRRSSAYVCEHCERTFTEEEIRALSGSKGALLAWEDLGNQELAYIHPSGGHIPPYSILVVKDSQIALYRASGHYYTFAEEGIYPGFCETRDSAEIAQTAYHMSDTGTAVPLQLDTAILFFSTKRQEFRYTPEDAIAVGKSGYVVIPEIMVQYCIDDPMLAKDQVLTGGSGSMKAHYQEVLQQIVPQKLGNMLAARFRDQFAVSGAGTAQLAETLSAYFSGEGYGQLEEKVNQELQDKSEGITVPYIQLDFSRGTIMTQADYQSLRSAQAECPVCGKRMPDLKADMACPSCAAKLHFCRSLSRYMPVSGTSCPYCYKAFLF